MRLPCKPALPLYNAHIPPPPPPPTCVSPHTCRSSHSFAFKGDLIKHTQCHIAPEERPRPFVCPYPGCGKAFAKAATLKNHDVVHTGARNYKCLYDGCGRTFTQAGQLAKHRKLHEAAITAAIAAEGLQGFDMSLSQHAAMSAHIMGGDLVAAAGALSEHDADAAAAGMGYDPMDGVGVDFDGSDGVVI
jgi:hypothetical protein